MTSRLCALLAANGALVILAGLAAGFPFGFVLLADLGIRDFPAMDFGAMVPGTTRAWRMAHLEGALNGVVMIAVAAAGSGLRLSRNRGRVLFWGFLAMGWGNIVASTLSPLTGGRGVSVSGLDWNSLVFVLFTLAAVGGVVGLVLLCAGGLAAARER